MSSIIQSEGTVTESLRRGLRGFGGIVIISVRFDLFAYSGCSSRFDPMECNWYWSRIPILRFTRHSALPICQRIKKANFTLSSDQVYEGEMAMANGNMRWV